MQLTRLNTDHTFILVKLFVAIHICVMNINLFIINLFQILIYYILSIYFLKITKGYRLKSTVPVLHYFRYFFIASDKIFSHSLDLSFASTSVFASEYILNKGSVPEGLTSVHPSE